MNGTKHNIRHRIPDDQRPLDNTSISNDTDLVQFKAKAAIAFITIVVIVIILLLFKASPSTPTITIADTSSNLSSESVSTPSIGPHYKAIPEHMYQFPDNIPAKSASGVIFFAHGCSHSATDFFASSSSCPQCLGLPEERNLIKFFLSHKYIVITISSQNRDHKCWNPMADTRPVQEVISVFKREYGIEQLPVYAFGASSGGGFVGSFIINQDFVKELNLKGVFVQISVVRMDVKDLFEEIQVPIMFIPMIMDKHLSNMVDDQLKILSMNGDELSRKCGLFPLPIDETFFYRQIGDKDGGNMNIDLSKAVYLKLKENDYLDVKGYLNVDPRRSDWRNAVNMVLKDKNVDDTLIADESAISEEMNVAWAIH